MSEAALSPPPSTTTRQIYDALVAHYRKPGTTAYDGELLLSEVQPPGSTRRCDLLRVGLWASRGRAIDVHEIKVSRSDWLRELDDPAKAEAWWPHSSRFWIVAPPSMIRPDELPEGWGLMVPPTQANRRRFKTVVEPAVRDVTPSMELLAVMLNRLENIQANRLHVIREEHRNELYRVVQRERQQRSTEALDRGVKDRLDLLKRFEKALGMQLDEYAFSSRDNRVTPEQLAEAMREYTADHVALQRRADRLDRVAEDFRRVANTVLNRVPAPAGGV